MNEERPLDETNSQRWLDRLADGELDETSRRSLFEWLDSDPVRWRSCALTLLESSELQSALGDWIAAAPPVVQQKPILAEPAKDARRASSTSTQRVSHSWRFVPLALLLSGAAFGLGIAVDRQWHADSAIATDLPKAKSNDARDSNVVENAMGLPESPKRKTDNGANVTVSHVGKDSTDGPDQTGSPQKIPGVQTAMLPDYVRGQLERQGYRVNSKQRLMSVVLPSGKEMMIPVEEWRFQYAGSRVY